MNQVLIKTIVVYLTLQEDLVEMINNINIKINNMRMIHLIKHNIWINKKEHRDFYNLRNNKNNLGNYKQNNFIQKMKNKSNN